MKQTRPINLVELILVMGGLYSTAYGVTHIVVETNAALLVIFAAGGLIWGVFWGGTRLSIRQTVGCTVFIGLLALGFILQQVFTPLLGALTSIIFWFEQLKAGAFTHLPDANAVISSGYHLWENFYPLYLRLAIWIRQLLIGIPTVDPLIITAIWTYSLWLVGSWAGWASRRIANSFLWLIPAMILLAGVSGYTHTHTISTFLLLAIVLPLSIFTAQINRERKWNAANLDFSTDIRVDLAISAGFLIATLLTAAALTPSITYQDIFNWWDKLTQPIESSQASEAARSFGLLAPTRLSPLAPYQSPGLPQEHLIGSGPDLSHKIVMTITSEDAPFAPWLGETRALPRHYWRTFTYDIYTGRGWVSSSYRSAAFSAHSVLTPQLPKTSSHLHYHINIIGNSNGLFFYTGLPQSSNTSLSLGYRSEKDLFGGTAFGQTYSVETAIPIHSAAQLVSAHSRIPAWISSRYLQLPENLPERVTLLAQRITASEISPYNQARAIENYLRQIPYNLDLPAPPTHEDVVNYFLFTQREGYCDYYASAMVVLARSAGLPARLVTGYASGTYDYRSGRWVITEADAHSWAEVYLADAGWVEFEPTASRHRLNPLSIPGIETGETNSLAKSYPPEHPIQWDQITKILLFSMGGVIIIAGLWLTLQSFWLRRLPADRASVWLLRNLQRSGSRLGVRTLPSQTPVEWMLRFRHRLKSVTHGELSPSMNHDLDTVQKFYLESIYSSHPLDRTQMHIVWGAGRRLSRKIRWILIQWNFKKLHQMYNDTRRRFNGQEMDRYNR